MEGLRSCVASILEYCIVPIGHCSFFSSLHDILIAISPLSVFFIYLGLTINDTDERRRSSLKTACLTAWAIMILALLSGQIFMKYVNITMESFKIASGILFIFLGFDVLHTKNDAENTACDKRRDIAIAPLGIPIIAGPGVIEEILARSTEMHHVWKFFSYLLAISMAILSIYIMLIIGARYVKRVPVVVQKLNFCLSGLFLIAMGIQFIMDGIRQTGLLSGFANQYVVSALF
jgi:multiple antibiotic resistance protein